jgi:hypothetical protein
VDVRRFDNSDDLTQIENGLCVSLRISAPSALKRS